METREKGGRERGGNADDRWRKEKGERKIDEI